MEWEPSLEALLKFTVHESTTMFLPSLQSALCLLLPRQLATTSRRPRTIPRAVSPHPASGAPEMVPATRRGPKNTEHGRQTSLQLTVHVHQGLPAFGQKLLLLPLCVPTASNTLLWRLWSAPESLLPPLPVAGPCPFRPKAFPLSVSLCAHPATWPP